MPKSGKLQNRYRKNSLIKGILDAISNNPPPSLKPWTGPFEIALRDRQNETIVSLLQQAGPALPKAMAFLQQLSESGQFSLMEKKYSVELFAAPVIFAAEIDNRGTISSRFATSDLGPLTEIFIDWFNPEAGQVILLDALPSSDEIEQQDYSGLLHLRENMTAALLAKKNTFPSPIPTAPIAHSGIPGENWHLRYIIGLLAQPAHENYQQLPAQAKPDEAKAKAWSKRLSIYLNMHIEATGTGFDVMPLLPNQVSYATEQAEAAFCLLQLEHFAIARAKKIYSNDTFPIRASYLENRQLILITVGDTYETIWDTVFPSWFIDKKQTIETIQEITRRCHIKNYDFIEFESYRNWRSSLEYPAQWLRPL